MYDVYFGMVQIYIVRRPWIQYFWGEEGARAHSHTNIELLN